METRGTAVIVVDTNIISYRWMASPQSELASKALAKDPDWIAPILWRSEFRNIIAGAIRHKLVDLEAAIHIMGEAERHFADREFAVSSRPVLNLVATSTCSAYDCEFVVLAQEQRVPLITLDRQLLRDFPHVAISLEKFVRA